ncbi:MAG TPA: phosphatase PAP2 family protein [Segetibacter sp.]
MKYITTLSIACATLLQTGFAQQTENKKTYTSPYSTSIKVDAPIIAGGIGLTALGVKLISNKKELTLAQLATKTRNKVPFFDRGNVGYYSTKADDASYIPFQASFAMPIVMALVNGNERHKIGQISVLYLETMSITGALFTMATGNIYRSRPYVYNTTLDEGLRRNKNSQRAFFAGHTAATAAATFFTAKVFQDFNPDSKAVPYVWVAAASVPALVGYLRYKAGMHFLSDNLLGYAIGAGAGILVPQLHKSKKFENVSFTPAIGNGSKGLVMTYTF